MKKKRAEISQSSLVMPMQNFISVLHAHHLNVIKALVQRKRITLNARVAPQPYNSLGMFPLLIVQGMMYSWLPC